MNQRDEVKGLDTLLLVLREEANSALGSTTTTTKISMGVGGGERKRGREGEGGKERGWGEREKELGQIAGFHHGIAKSPDLGEGFRVCISSKNHTLNTTG